MKQSMRECSRKGCKNTVSPEKSFKMCAACLAAGLRWRQKSKDKKLEARKQGVRLCARAWCYTKLPKDSLTSTCANCLRSGAERYRRAKQAKVATGCCLYCPQRAVGTRNFCLTHSLKDRRGQLRIRARKRNSQIVPFTTDELAARMEAQGNQCVYCGGPFEQIDHFKPLALGGAHCLANLRPSCANCNNHKGPMPPLKWLKSLAS